MEGEREGVAQHFEGGCGEQDVDARGEIGLGEVGFKKCAKHACVYVCMHDLVVFKSMCMCVYTITCMIASIGRLEAHIFSCWDTQRMHGRILYVCI